MESILANCGSVFSANGSLFATFFVAGLTGGFSHCLAMCGPIVAGQSACASGCRNNHMNNVEKNSQLSYHSGRIVTYSLLGLIASAMAMQIAATSFWPYLSSGMLIAAGFMFIFSSIKPSRNSSCGKFAKTNFLRGLLLGFMPCGMLYAALMMAATITNPLAGAFAMFLFTVGTIPALLLASGSLQLISKKWRYLIPGVGRTVMAFNGLSLLILAARIVR